MKNPTLAQLYLLSNLNDSTRNLLLPLYRKKHDTKVFCVGESKTGTTSLHRALGIIGYRNIHWPNHGTAPQECLIDYIKTHNFDAYSDYPTPVYYKEIDNAFPNSKFILTIRDIPSWQKSTVYFFQGTPWEIHGEIGLKSRTNYVNNHNESVKEHFKDRPDNLLVINIYEGDGFEKLCPFLNKPIPKEVFPHTNKGDSFINSQCKKIYNFFQ